MRGNSNARTMQLVLLVVILLVPLGRPAMASDPRAPSSPIKHVVVIVQENHTFDNYFGTFPGANGISNDPPGVHPFHIAGGAGVNMCHSTSCAHQAYHDGKMDGFLSAEGSNATFGYFDKSDIPYYWALAQNYTLFDNYFTAAMGPSLPNHLYLVSAQDAGIADSVVNQHSDLNISSIANELQAANDTWAYYSPYNIGNENALGLVYSVDHSSTMSANLKYTDQFLQDLQDGRLPNVSYVTAPDGLNEHPPSDIAAGQAWVSSLVKGIQATQYWGSTAILITWDDYGGFYDHVAPPRLDKFGDGFRVPLLLISPFAKSGHIDHTLCDHTSILKFIERVFGLPPMTHRDASAYDFSGALNSRYWLAAARYQDDAVLLQGAPSVLNSTSSSLLMGSQFRVSIGATYMDDLNRSVDVVFHATLRNVSNQTVQMTTIRERVSAHTSTEVWFFFREETPGAYYLRVMPTTPKGTPLAQPFTMYVASSTW
jgi:phospholipase C